ncbi:glutaminyl-peptide cyclotransferase [Glycomyces halotolerans]
MSSVFKQQRAVAVSAAALVALVGCGTGDADADVSTAEVDPEAVERLTVEILDSFDHDPQAFTQGLELRDGVLYESTGLYGSSDVRTVDPATGEVIASQTLPAEHFAEGLTLTDDALWQITWQSGVAYRRDMQTLDVVGTVEYEGEGWGLCHDGRRLVMSDGTSTLTFRDPATFETTGTVDVTFDGAPISQINELECVDGDVWANVWQTDEIIRIDPETGEVGAVVDAAGLLTEEQAAAADVLNGIAAAETPGTFYITGKLWPQLFLVEFS